MAGTDKPEGAVSAAEALKGNGAEPHGDGAGAATAPAAAATATAATAAGGAAGNGHLDVSARTLEALDQPVRLRAAAEIPTDFEFGEVRAPALPPPTPAPALGPLSAFVGTFQGTGFNTIFRPDSTKTPTPLPKPLGGDNVLELNITRETLSFSPALGSVPNRGTGAQGDAFLNGVPYVQTISDVTGGQNTGIHFEPGLWIVVPATDIPAEGQTVARMASIPHGTTINAQGTARTFPGAPRISPVDITPTIVGTTNKIRFASQTASNQDTPRIPQDLSPFITAGTITQAILDDPNTLLRNHNAGLNIIETTVINIATSPPLPLFAGGTDNIAFLAGNPAANTNPSAGGQNAQTTLMTATFWINTVEHIIIVPPFQVGSAPLMLKPESTLPSHLLPTFIVRPPIPIPTPRPIKVQTTQIQYSQLVDLVFAGLTWPHVSVASLIPSAPVSVPPSAWQ